MQIVSRAQWGARFNGGFGPAPLPAREVWLHHSVTAAPDLVSPYGDEDAAMRVLEQIGQDRFGGGVSYTFAVMPTGRVYEGHGVRRQGAHTKGRNDVARAIVLVGNYDAGRPTAAQIEAVARLLVHGTRAGWWDEPRLDGGHQQAPGASTACPGRHGMAAIEHINRRAAALAEEEEDDVSAADVWTMPLSNRSIDPRGDWGARDRLLSVDVNIQRLVDHAARQERTLAAQQATIDGLARLIAHWSGLSLDDIERTVRDAIAAAVPAALADGIDLDVTVGARTPTG